MNSSSCFRIRKLKSLIYGLKKCNYAPSDCHCRYYPAADAYIGI